MLRLVRRRKPTELETNNSNRQAALACFHALTSEGIGRSFCGGHDVGEQLVLLIGVPGRVPNSERNRCVLVIGSSKHMLFPSTSTSTYCCTIWLLARPDACLFGNTCHHATRGSITILRPRSCLPGCLRSSALGWPLSIGQ